MITIRTSILSVITARKRLERSFTLFGYVRPCKPELKIKDYAIYKAVYCGLCHSLGRRYGFLSRFILSYDATLLCMVQMSQKTDCCGFEKKRCPANPLKKCDCAGATPELDFWADASVILGYYKVADNLHDKGYFKKLAALLLLPFASHLFHIAAKRNSFIFQCTQDYIKQQTAVEKSRCAVIDEAAQPTAELLAKLLRNGTDGDQSRVLERIGYFLGRWIQLADAAHDLEKDVKVGEYNPFATATSLTAGMPLDKARKAADTLLNSCIFEITTAYDLLETKRFAPIIANVFFDGLPMVKKYVLSVLSKREKKKLFPSMYNTDSN